MASIKNKQIDLLVAYNRSDEPSKFSKILRASIVPLIIFVIAVGIAAFMFMLILNKQAELDNLNAEIEIVQLKIDSLDKTPYDELSKMESALSSIEQLDKSLSNLPELTKNKIMYLRNDLLAGMSLKSISFDQTTNILNASFSSNNVQNIQKYVTKIRKHVEFATVDYTGYQETSSPVIKDVGDILSGDYNIVDTVSSYSFNLKISLDGKVSE